jgi:hypothetical protein
MKNTCRFLFVLSSLVTVGHPLRSQWLQMSGPNVAPCCFVVSGNDIFAGTLGGGVCRSTNSGTSWTPVDSGMTNFVVNALAVSPNGAGGTVMFAGSGRGVFRSTNNGTSWTASGLSGLRVKTLAVSPATGGTGGTNVFAGTPDAVFRSPDNGTHWDPVSSGLTGSNIWALAVSPATSGTGGTNVFAGTRDGIFLSTDNGDNWTLLNTGLDDTSIQALIAVGTHVFAANWRRVLCSTNNGTSWTDISDGLPPYSDINALAGSGMNVFAGSYGQGVFHSTNNGASWTAVNDGLTNTYVWALAVVGTNVLAGTEGVAAEGGRFWRRPLSEMVTKVEKVSTDLPTRFSLDQNYPNPFNPSTNITFSLPSRSSVSLKIFDALGREVSTLLAGELDAGTHTRQWNAGASPSGVYFVRLQAGEASSGSASGFVETKKMIVLK